MASLRSLATFRAMKTNTRPKVPDEVGSYAELQRQIHDALRAEHPEWSSPTAIAQPANHTNRGLLNRSGS
jgi:hypothetical protein